MRGGIYVFNIIFLYLLFYCTLAYSQDNRPARVYTAEEIKYPDMQKIENEIKIANLLNNLDLTKEQMGFFLEKARSIEISTRKLYKDYAYYSRQMFGLEKKIKAMADRGKVDQNDPVALLYRQTKNRRNLVFYRINDEIEAAVRSAEAKLEKFQLIVIENYQPCVIPVVSENHIGGSDKDKSVGLIVMDARSIPAERFAREKNAFVERCYTELKTMFCTCLRVCDEDSAKKEMLKTIEKIRGMDEVDFKLNMKKLALELEEKIILKEPELSRQQKIWKFLLSSQSIPVLEKRLRDK